VSASFLRPHSCLLIRRQKNHVLIMGMIWKAFQHRIPSFSVCQKSLSCTIYLAYIEYLIYVLNNGGSAVSLYTVPLLPPNKPKLGGRTTWHGKKQHSSRSGSQP
jgi:hypothetical protein